MTKSAGNFESSIIQKMLQNLMIIVGMWLTMTTISKSKKNHDQRYIILSLIRLLQALHTDKWVKFEMFIKKKKSEQEIEEIPKADTDPKFEDIDLDKMEEAELLNQEMIDKQIEEEKIDFGKNSQNSNSEIISFRNEPQQQKLTSHKIASFIWESYEEFWSALTKEDFLNLSPAMLVMIIRTMVKDDNTDTQTNIKRIVALSVSANTKIEDEGTKKMPHYYSYSMWILNEILKFKNSFLLKELNENNQKLGNDKHLPLGSSYSKIEVPTSYLDNIIGTEKDFQKFCKYLDCVWLWI